jgi:seryl-tRNA synthetase
LATAVKEADSKRAEAEEHTKALVMKLSNVLDPGAPIGGEADFKVLEHVGTPRKFDFEPKDHVELGKLLGAIDTERGAKVAGSRSYYLTGSGALLEFALVNYAISMAVKAGFVPVIPPVLVNPAAMEGTGFLGQAAENVYRIEKDDVYLVGTSEVPLAAMHMDEVLSGDKLPMRYAGYSSCFRREAGTYGKDTRGIIRVHQFDKVEMFSFCHPDQAKEEHARILQWEKDFLDAMEIPYRVIDVASGDLGSSANRKFDCEAWIPTQDAYREVTSTSNCTEFQARRLNIRYKNHQNADGTVNIPKALQPFLGKERFELV